MITREFNLYLHAGHSIPLVINANQYDRGEQWLFTLFNSDGTKYTPSSGAIVGIKSDGLGIINTGSVDSQGRVVINETQQMTAAVGKATFELTIDSQTHGTANFIVLVEPKPGDNASLSESDLSLIQQAIDSTNPAAIKQGVQEWMDENLDTSSVVDETLSISGAAADAKKTGDELNDLKSAVKQNIFLLPRHNAVISGSNVWSTNSNGSTQCVAVPVDGGETLEITHKSGITFHLAFLKSWSEPVSGETPDFCTGYASRIVIQAGDITTTRTIPTDCRFVYVLTLNNNSDYSPDKFVIDSYDWCISNYDNIMAVIDETEDTLQAEIDNIDDLLNGSKTLNSFALIDGYANYNTGALSTYSGDGKYKRTDYIPIENVASIQSNFNSNADAGYAFYTSAKAYISGGTSYPIIGVPINAAFIVFSNYSSGADHTGLYATFTYRSLVGKTIACYGDSVTEGMGMSDIGTATYGGDTYPSQLFTLLSDNGFNIDVKNYGHSGERSTEVCARVGGRICGYLGEDVTIPSNNAGTSLGVAVVSNYKVTGSKLYSTGKNADGTTAQLLFTKLGHDTRPLMIGDYLCNIYQAQQEGGMLQTINFVTPQGKEVTIPALSVLTTGNSKRNPDICVVYMGINDGTNLTLTEWIDRCKSVIERNPKTLILGSTNHNWTFWTGMTGTDAEKRATYLNACLANFGSYYLDLYDILTTEKGINIAVSAGKLSGRTEEQITADNNAIANRQTPPSLTLEGTAGEVHLNSIGYYVLAKSVYDKLAQLGLI